jgi:hypothetical protein
MSIDQELSTLVVQKENPLKQMLVEYVGNKYYEESDEGDFEVTVQMIVETLAIEFPEFVMIMAEENWVRGYEQGIKDGTSILERTKSEA